MDMLVLQQCLQRVLVYCCLTALKIKDIFTLGLVGIF